MTASNSRSRGSATSREVRLASAGDAPRRAALDATPDFTTACWVRVRAEEPLTVLNAEP
jgi:hypothetical protein